MIDIKFSPACSMRMPGGGSAEENSPGRDATDAQLKEFDVLIDDFDVAMLVTESLDGDLRGRPMAIAGHDRGAVLYFLTRSDDEKLQELLRRDDIVVCMQGEGQYMSISGRARLETDRVMIDRYWSSSARLWFPDGPGDPDATLVVFEPTCAECWDRSGVRRLEFLWEAGKALLQGRKADDLALSGHRQVRVDDHTRK